MKKWMENNKVILILTFIAMVAIPILSFIGLKPQCIINCKPNFVFTYEGTGQPVYEVAEGLNGLNSANGIQPFSITIEVPNYAGSGYNGAIDVFAEKSDANRSRVRLGGWTNFRNEFQTPLIITLMPGQLFEFSSLPRGIDSYLWDTKQSEIIKGNFDLVIAYTDGNELARDTITVVHTPWYHETSLSGTILSQGESVRAMVRVTNLGQPARFKISANLYDTLDPDLGSLLAPDGWWAGQTWINGTTFEDSKVATSMVPQNGHFDFEFLIPKSAFEAGHIYALETVAYKELPYLKFSRGDWLSSDERWRFKDHTEFQTILIVK